MDEDRRDLRPQGSLVPDEIYPPDPDEPSFADDDADEPRSIWRRLGFAAYVVFVLLIVFGLIVGGVVSGLIAEFAGH